MIRYYALKDSPGSDPFALGALDDAGGCLLWDGKTWAQQAWVMEYIYGFGVDACSKKISERDARRRWGDEIVTGR